MDTNTKDDAYAVIFISNEGDKAAFDESFQGMPWLALPFGDMRILSLFDKLEIRTIRVVVAFGLMGEIVMKEGKGFIGAYGADAYPFTDTTSRIW